MPDPTHSFPLPMNRSAMAGFFLGTALVAGIAAWCFASGLVWSAVCLIAVAAPLTLLGWYMLYVNPSRAMILADHAGLILSAPPFVNQRIEFADISETGRADLGDGSLLAPGRPERGMKWGAYRLGTFALENGGTAVVAASSRAALLVRTPEGVFLLGPRDLDGLESLIQDARS